MAIILFLITSFASSRFKAPDFYSSFVRHFLLFSRYTQSKLISYLVSFTLFTSFYLDSASPSFQYSECPQLFTANSAITGCLCKCRRFPVLDVYEVHTVLFRSPTMRCVTHSAPTVNMRPLLETERKTGKFSVYNQKCGNRFLSSNGAQGLVPQ